MKLYHFCIMCQASEAGSLRYFDGTLSFDGDLRKKEQYDALKNELALSIAPPISNGKDVVLLSLTNIE